MRVMVDINEYLYPHHSTFISWVLTRVCNPSGLWVWYSVGERGHSTVTLPIKKLETLAGKTVELVKIEHFPSETFMDCLPHPLPIPPPKFVNKSFAEGGNIATFANVFTPKVFSYTQ